MLIDFAFSVARAERSEVEVTRSTVDPAWAFSAPTSLGGGESMALIEATPRSSVATAFASAAQHVIDVWCEPGFQAALRRETKRFFKSIASEAGAASHRIRS